MKNDLDAYLKKRPSDYEEHQRRLVRSSGSCFSLIDQANTLIGGVVSQASYLNAGSILNATSGLADRVHTT